MSHHLLHSVDTQILYLTLKKRERERDHKLVMSVTNGVVYRIVNLSKVR